MDSNVLHGHLAEINSIFKHCKMQMKIGEGYYGVSRLKFYWNFGCYGIAKDINGRQAVSTANIL